MKAYQPFYSCFLPFYLLLLLILLLTNDAKKHKVFDGTEEFGVDTSNHLNPEKSKSYLNKKRMEDRAEIIRKRQK